METAKHFLSKEDQARIVAAIEKAEAMTSGEIRVHLATWVLGDPYRKAKKIFQRLGMTKTEARNGILFFIVIHKHQFVILGDQGIHDKVHQEFWDSLKELLEQRFKEGNIAQGLLDVISLCGQKLKTYFPASSRNVNELDNAISVQ